MIAALEGTTAWSHRHLKVPNRRRHLQSGAVMPSAGKSNVCNPTTSGTSSTVIGEKMGDPALPHQASSGQLVPKKELQANRQGKTLATFEPHHTKDRSGLLCFPFQEMMPSPMDGRTTSAAQTLQVLGE